MPTNGKSLNQMSRYLFFLHDQKREQLKQVGMKLEATDGFDKSLLVKEVEFLQSEIKVIESIHGTIMNLEKVFDDAVVAELTTEQYNKMTDRMLPFCLAWDEA